MSRVALLQRNAAMFHRLLAVCLSAFLLTTMYGCEVGEFSQKTTETRKTRRTLDPPTKPAATSTDEQVAEAQFPESTGGKVLERPGPLVHGLDGELYLPYPAATIHRVQSALKDRGLYQGLVHGVLDPETMKSIYAFQEASTTLQRCGVPTPRTRKLLAQGSHTDPAS